jgi:hypothetical protein
MIDRNTFLTTLYVMADDFLQGKDGFRTTTWTTGFFGTGRSDHIGTVGAILVVSQLTRFLSVCSKEPQA